MYVETKQTAESLAFDIDQWLGGLSISGEVPERIIVTKDEWDLLDDMDLISRGDDDVYRYEFDEMFFDIQLDKSND